MKICRLFIILGFIGLSSTAFASVCTPQQTEKVVRARRNAQQIYQQNYQQVSSFASPRGQQNVIDCIGMRLRQPMRFRCVGFNDGYTAKTTGALISDPVGNPTSFRPKFFYYPVRQLNNRDQWVSRNVESSKDEQTLVILHELSHNCGVTDEPYIFDSKGDYFAILIMNGYIPYD